MKFLKGKGAAFIVGAAAGASLDALAITMIFGMQTGIAGAVLVLLIVVVSGFLGWLIGLDQGIRK